MEPQKLIDQWRRALRISVRAHYEAAKSYQRLHWWLSIPAIIISAALGTSVMVSLQHSAVGWIKTVMAVLSVATVVLSSLLASLKFAERAERHKAATAQLTEVRHALEEDIVFNRLDQATISALRKKWDDAERQAPTIPSRIYDRVASLVGRLEKEEATDSSLTPITTNEMPPVSGSEEKMTRSGKA
jgi:SMODS and SLOG-associating 2TM effector domain family 4